MLHRRSDARVSLLASGKNMIPFLSTLLVLTALSGQGTAATTPDPVDSLTLNIDTTTNTLSIQWTDTQENLNYQISYNVSARTVILSSDDPFVTNAMVLVSDSDTMFEHSITNATYFVEGVTVEVTVAAVNDSEVGPSIMNTTMALGTFAPPVDSLVAIPDTNMPIVNLTWIIPYPQVPPDSYELTFTATKLSGVPLAEGSETEMMDFFDNETISYGNGRTFTVTDLLFYSHYQFELVAVYGDDSSTAARNNVTMTAEGTPGPVRSLTFEFNSTVANFNATSGTFSDITAMVSWAEPEEPNGTISYEYNIVLESDPSDIVISGSTMMTSVGPLVTVNVYTRYMVTVTARTGGGFLGTPISQAEFSPEAAPSAVQDLNATSNGSHVLISWSEPASPNGIVTYSVVVMERDLLTNETSTVASETMVTGLELVVDYTVEPYSEYSVNVTSQTGAGMGDPALTSFQTPEEAPTAPRSVTLQEISSTYAIIRWTEPEFPNGVIRRYTLSFTNADDGTEGNISTDQLSVNVTELVPFTQYWIVVFAETVAVGDGSSNISIRTLQDIPSPVQNLVVNFNTSHINITWGIPASPNGQVNYTVVVQEIDLLTREITLIEMLTISEENLIVMYRVRPYSMYNVSVTSLTIVGEGDVVMESFITDEAVPTPARNLTLDNNDTHIFITWAAPANPNGIVNYTVDVQERSLLNGAPATTIESIVTTDLELIVELELESYSEYTVNVTSQTSAGMGMAVSDSFETPEGVPSPVRNLMRSFNGTHITFITWEAPEFPRGEVNYTVVIQERDLLTDDTDVIAVYEVVELEVMVDYPVEAYSEYTINVTSQTSAGEGDTETIVFQTAEEVPSPAQNVSVSSNGTHITITWEPPSQPNGVVNYTVLLLETDLVQNTTVTIASEEVTDLLLVVPFMAEPYREYVAMVTAQTGAGPGESARDMLTTPEGVPSEVRNLTITQNNETLLILWLDSSMPNGIVTYVITITCFDLATNNLTFAEVYNISFGGDLRIYIPFPGGLEPYAEYTATIIASTRAGNSSEMTDMLTTPQGESEPPQNLVTTPTNISVTVEWAPPLVANGVISSYLVDLFNSSDDEIDTARVNNSGALEHTFMALLPYTIYSVEVRAVTGDMVDILGQVAEDSFITDIGIPTVPNNVMIMSGVGSLTVSWMPPDLLNAPTVNYAILYSMTGSPMERRITVGGDTMAVIGGLAAFMEYSVVVQACSSAGCGLFTEPVTERTQEEVPSPVRNLTQSFNGTHITFVSWEAPEFPRGEVNFTVVIQERDLLTDDTDVVAMYEVVELEVMVDYPVEAYSEYTINVTSQTSAGEGDTETTMFQTPEEAPTAAPQILAEMAITAATNITITWDPPPVEETNGIIRSYTVIYSPLSNVSAPPTEESVLGNETSFTASGLEPFTNYTFEVAAVTVGPGPSDSIIVQTDEAAPSAPVIMDAVNTSSTSIRVTWTPPLFRNGIIRRYIITYYITRDGGPSASDSMMIVMGDATMAEVTGLMIFTNYSISIVAETVDLGDPSETVTVTTDEDLPSAPQILEIFEDNTTAVTIQVTFEPPTTPNGIITHYLVNYSISDNSTNQNEVSTRVEAVEGQMMYTVELFNLTEFTRYTIEVSAFTRIGEGNVSTRIIVTDPDVASPPTNLVATVINSTAVELTWGYPLFPRGRISGYIISVSGGLDSEFINQTLETLDDTSSQSFTVDMLQPFTTYTFSVAAYAVHQGAVIEGATSERTVTTLEAVPSEPLNFMLSRVNQPPEQLLASWATPDPTNGNIVSYTVLCRENGTMSEFTVREVVEGMGTMTQLTGLSPFTAYECFVTGNTSVGAGSPSNLDVETTNEAVPSAPLNFMLSRENQPPEQLLASWATPNPTNGEIISYTISCRENGTMSEFTVREVVEGMATMTQLTGLSPFTAYECFVMGNTSAGAGSPSDLDIERTNEAVPSAPLNFMLSRVNQPPDQLLALWATPDPTNGNIVSYTVLCRENGTMSEFTVREVVEGMATMTQLADLSPFTAYECFVTGNTSVGAGNPSNLDIERTNEAVPSAPENFMAIDVQARNVSFSWSRPLSPNGNIDAYILSYFNTTHNITLALMAEQRMVTVEYLNEFTDYTFELRARTGAGLGEPAAEILTTQQAAPTAPPLNVTGEFNDSTSINISWSPPPFSDQNGNIVAYNITYQRTDGSGGGDIMTVTSDEFITISNLAPYTNYSVMVAAFTIARGPFSEQIIVQTDSTTPTAPRNVTVVDVTRGSITIIWLPPDPTNGMIESYDIEVTPVDDNSDMIRLITVTPMDELMYNISGLMEYVNYSIIVFARTDKGRGPGSEAIIVQTLEHHPDEPTNFNVIVLNSTSLSVTWGPPADPNGIIRSYHLFVELDPADAAYLPGDPTMNITIENPDARSYILSGLHEFATYSLRLAAATEQGVGNSTETFQRKTATAAPSSDVVNITARDSDVQSTSVRLTWSPPPIRDWNGVITNYNISYRTVVSCDQQDEILELDFLVSSNSSLTSPKLPGDPRAAYNRSLDVALVESDIVNMLEAYISYVFSVTAETSEGSSPPEERCVMTEPSVPGIPTLQSFTVLSNTTASVSWMLSLLDHNGILDKYVVEITNVNMSTVRNCSVPANESSFYFSGLEPFTNYSVRVLASNEQRGEGAFSMEITNMTSEGVPSYPRGLRVVATNTTYISLSWDPPAVINADELGPYNITYYQTEQATQMETDSTYDTSIVLTGLTGNINYTIEVTASTSAGEGNSSSITAITPPGASPPVVNNLDIVPKMRMDDNGQSVGVTPTSFVVEFELVPQQEINGPIDEYWIYVWRQPSTNRSIAFYYESSRMTSNFSQYASVSQKPQRSTSRKRATGGMMQTVTVGGDQDCTPTDNPCNGPLAPDSQYFVRYALFSGGQRTDYNFTMQAFSTSAEPTTASSNSLEVIIPVVVVILVIVIIVVVVVIVIVLYMKKRRRGDFDLKVSYKNGHNGDQKLLPRNESGSNVPFLGRSDPGIVPIHEMKEGGTPLKASQAKFPRHIQNTKVYLKDFSEHLKAMLDDSNYKFSEEYERVTEIGLEHAKEASLMAENRAKNRYTNILAYDHSRVKLSFIDDEPGSDYINASYIPGHRMRRAYVATQGPLPATFDDFWRMVWEQNTHVIVMLTQLVERGRTKCHRYWPGTEPSVYGDIAVEMISEKEKEDWTIREFKLSVPDSRTRLVRHYQFTSWPDHGVPDTPLAAIDFVKTVRSQVEPHHGPLVVHCSAGVGRTGCFIALDTLQQHVRDHDWVDIYGLACEMRQHRNHMIQTEAQYVFIHKSMQEIIDSVARYGPGVGLGMGTIGSAGIHVRPGYSSVFANPFAEEASTTQMSDYYGDYLSEETHM